jgi:hypothetical protein
MPTNRENPASLIGDDRAFDGVCLEADISEDSPSHPLVQRHDGFRLFGDIAADVVWRLRREVRS